MSTARSVHRQAPRPIAPVATRRRPTTTAARCVACDQHVVEARTVDGDDITLDARADGQPGVVAHGRYLEVAATLDLLGRRPLTVMAVDDGTGQYRAHRCLGELRRRVGR